jgi:hypothetical protein
MSDNAAQRALHATARATDSLQESLQESLAGVGEGLIATVNSKRPHGSQVAALGSRRRMAIIVGVLAGMGAMTLVAQRKAKPRSPLPPPAAISTADIGPEPAITNW